MREAFVLLTFYPKNRGDSYLFFEKIFKTSYKTTEGRQRTAHRRGRIYSGFRHWYNGDRSQRWSSLSLALPRAAARKPGSRTPQAERFSVMEMHSLTAM